MTVIEKKKNIKRIVDKLSEDNLDEALHLVEELAVKDLKRKEILLELLKSEKNLFQRLAK